MIMVRPYRESDLAGMQALNVRAMSDGETGAPAPDGMTRDLQVTFERKLGFWVATESDDDAEIVGMIALRTPDDDAPPGSIGGGRHVCEVVSFRVSPDHQRKGIGTMLINTVIDWSRQGAYDAVIVNATPDRVAAMGVYRSLGFHQVPSTFRGTREILWFELPLDREGPSR
jgi:ribosomal protein S18 acetylase RimI-like enzyme